MFKFGETGRSAIADVPDLHPDTVSVDLSDYLGSAACACRHAGCRKDETLLGGVDRDHMRRQVHEQAHTSALTDTGPTATGPAEGLTRTQRVR